MMEGKEMKAFGLPAGTVRAILAFALVGGLLAAYFLRIDEVETLKSLTAMALGFYFGQRSNGKAG